MKLRSRMTAARPIPALGVSAAILAVFLTIRFGAAASGPPESVDALAPGAAAMIATIDSETGELEVGSRPLSLPLTPELQNAMSRSAEGLIETVHPDGSVSIDLQGRFQSVSVVHLGEHGPDVTCSDHEHHVTNALTRPSAPALEVQ